MGNKTVKQPEKKLCPICHQSTHEICSNFTSSSLLSDKDMEKFEERATYKRKYVPPLGFEFMEYRGQIFVQHIKEDSVAAKIGMYDGQYIESIKTWNS